MVVEAATLPKPFETKAKFVARFVVVIVETHPVSAAVTEGLKFCHVLSHR